MATYRYTNRLCSTALVFAMLMMTGAAVEWYDDVPTRPLDGEILYQENYNMDVGPQAFDQAEDAKKDVIDKEINQAMLLYNIMQGLKLKSELAGQYRKMKNSPNSDAVEYIDFAQNVPETIATKPRIVKRLADAVNEDEMKNASKTTPAYRLKPKKLKASSK